MKKLLTIATSLCLCANALALQPTVSKAIPQQKQMSLTPKRALELLKEGNQRFLSGKMRRYDFNKEMKTTTRQGQFPLGIVLSCIDSRSIPDILFDQGLGNVFVSRMAGNVADKDLLGSMEFATKLAGARLVLVMGHTHCGAIRGACSKKDSTGLSNLDFLLSKIQPAVETVRKASPDAQCSNDKTVDHMARQNVLNQMAYIQNNSPAIAALMKSGDVMMVGAMHHIKTGQVEFFNAKGEGL